MSAIGFLSLQGRAALALGFLSPLFGTRRSIGGIVAEVTVKEQHLDSIRMTDQPVEQGATITDHAFKLPAECTIQVGWSRGVFTLLNSNYLNETYGRLLTLQNSRIPFTLITERRIYRNMLISTLSTEVDKSTANILLVTARCREILLVNTQIIVVPPNDVQVEPQVTGSIEDFGSQQLQPAPNFNGSALPTFNGGSA